MQIQMGRVKCILEATRLYHLADLSLCSIASWLLGYFISLSLTFFIFRVKWVEIKLNYHTVDSSAMNCPSLQWFAFLNMCLKPAIFQRNTSLKNFFNREPFLSLRLRIYWLYLTISQVLKKKYFFSPTTFTFSEFYWKGQHCHRSWHSHYRVYSLLNR